MNMRRWDLVTQIFQAAIEEPPSQRLEFVRKACHKDPEIEAEVLSLLEADKLAGSFLERSPMEDIPSSYPKGRVPGLFSPGDLISQRFQIRRLIGQGGMGQVYEAYDTELNTRVALKIIRPEISSSPDVLSRFKQELQLTRRITHPNVCRTFDLDRHTPSEGDGPNTDVFFLSMEFLDGETLADLIRRARRLATSDALPLASQMIDALTAAHEVGIIHRDFKPSNVLLVPFNSRTRVVVTDFGLARVMPDSCSWSERMVSSLTGGEQLLGTLIYMAPEQVELGEATAASDIYALGLVLYEMVTGKRPFEDPHPFVEAVKRVKQQPESPKAHVPDLDVSWEAAICHCLQTDPSARPPSVRTVAELVRAVPHGATFSRARRSLREEPALVTNGKVSGKLNWKHNWALLALFFFVAAVSLILGGLRIYRSGEHSRVAPGALVYLTQVKNQTGEKTFDYLTELIQAGLAQSARINVLDPGRIGDTLQQMNKPPDATIDQPIAREIAMRTGAARVIFVDVTGSAGDYHLNIDIQEPDNTPTRYREHWPKSFTWHASGSTTSTTIPPELLTAIRTSSNWIRFEVGEAANDIASLDTPPEDVTTSDWRALADYSRAEQLNHQLKKDDAIAALNSAVAFDPQFALAYARIGDIEFSLGRSEEGYRAYAHSLASDFDRRLTRRELDRVRGIYASDSWDYAAAETAFRDYTVFYPNDFLGWFYRALPLVHLGRFDEAIATLKNAERVAPGGIYAPYDLALCYAEVGDLASARHWIDVLRKRNDPEGAELLEGVLSFLAGNGADAIRSFESLRASSLPNFRFLGHSLPARVFAEQGDYQRSFNASLAAEAESNSRGNRARQAKSLLDQAYIQCILGLYSACLSTTQRALSLDTSPELLMNASDLFIRAIDLTSGSTKLQLRSALVALPGRIPADTENVAYTIASLHLRAAVLASSGHLAQAIAEARREAAIDTQFRRRDLLARLLLRAAAQASDPMRQQALRAEARENYARSALHPAAIWLQPWLYAPGVWTEDFEAFLQAFPPADAARTDTETAATLFHKIRFAPSTPSGKGAARMTSSTSKGGDQSQKENQE
jgi:serine/threonine protein kinase/tetratricopeptide (TPR) repeat protein